MGQPRIEQIQRRMAVAGVDATVLTLPENVVLATGFYVRVPGFGLVLVPQEGEAVLLVADFDRERAERVWSGEIRLLVAGDFGPAPRAKGLVSLLGMGSSLAANVRRFSEESGVAGGRIGFEGSFEQVAPPILVEPNTVGLPTQAMLKELFHTEELVDLTAPLEQIRAIKTEAEIERIRVVNEIAELGHAALREETIVGRTEAQVRSMVEGAICDLGHGHEGAETVRALATVGAGEHLLTHGWQYAITGGRIVAEGDYVMVEMGTVADGYWADTTRTVVAGGPGSDLQRRADEVIREAAAAAFAAAIPGATGDEVDRVARSICERSGLEGVYPHQTGHGIGFRYHENLPNIFPGSDDVLAEGMVIAVEPGFYSDELGSGIRQEYNGVVRSGGTVPLLPLDHPLGNRG